MGAWLEGIGRRDDLIRTLLAFAVVAVLGLGGAALGNGSVLGQQGGSSGSSSSGEGSGGSSGSSNSNSEDGSSNSSSQDGDGTSNSSSEDGSSNSNGSSSGSSSDDDGGATSVPPVTGAPSDGGTTPTTPSAPTTTIAPTASTIPPDLPEDVPPTDEVDCPDDVASSSQGGRVRCFEVDADDLDAGDEIGRVGIPGIPLPVPLVTDIVVPINGDTGDSGSTTNDNSVTVVYDIDNRVAVDGFAEDTARAGQRVLATIALLMLIPVWVVLVVALARFLRRSGGPPPGTPPPPAGRWVWEPADAEQPPKDAP